MHGLAIWVLLTGCGLGQVKDLLEGGCTDNDCICPTGEACDLVCDDSSESCDAICNGSLSCDVDCSSHVDCSVICIQADNCAVDCADAEACDVSCSGAEACDVDCTGVADCDVDCPGGCRVTGCDLEDGCRVSCDEGFPVQEANAVICP